MPSTITTLGKLQANGHILFIKAQSNRAIGFLKVGYKKLFMRGRGGEMVEMKPLAVLDFYVDASVQRGGIGKTLFDCMLVYMNAKPALLAYDRPSDKLMGFLAKHCKLKNFVPQNNNYVVFDDYFTTSASSPAAAKESSMPPGDSLGLARSSTISTQQTSTEHHRRTGGGWPQTGTMVGSETRTHYPRASHYNQTFRIGGDVAVPSQTVKRQSEANH